MIRLTFMFKQFLREPLWFKLLISAALLAAIIGSSSIFSENAYYQSAAKLAAAAFFLTYGIKMRMNRKVSFLFFALAVICLYLSWHNLVPA
ncbi:hypothetical protein SAMN02799630_01149 [Paenibacillus sp. UNCCL117]|uniref:hypothetical protein n=1 Tax=unclassified Paenibacillus TaxID=185978 RepID=UPI00088A1B22|nr:MULTISPECIES: hypothetical protein [unclassified Paenibacillus]SDC67611.1 hypothetical protein SAMN04488602_103126 [Paenibacillus sp. cl123]SFW23368.1 hypothetical protein SAMN02799630_01149 [Paenibacillus sp. UNCCL117]